MADSFIPETDSFIEEPDSFIPETDSFIPDEQGVDLARQTPVGAVVQPIKMAARAIGRLADKTLPPVQAPKPVPSLRAPGGVTGPIDNSALGGDAAGLHPSLGWMTRQRMAEQAINDALPYERLANAIALNGLTPEQARRQRERQQFVMSVAPVVAGIPAAASVGPAALKSVLAYSGAYEGLQQFKNLAVPHMKGEPYRPLARRMLSEMIPAGTPEGVKLAAGLTEMGIDVALIGGMMDMAAQGMLRRNIRKFGDAYEQKYGPDQRKAFDDFMDPFVKRAETTVGTELERAAKLKKTNLADRIGASETGLAPQRAPGWQEEPFGVPRQDPFVTPAPDADRGGQVPGIADPHSIVAIDAASGKPIVKMTPSETPALDMRTTDTKSEQTTPQVDVNVTMRPLNNKGNVWRVYYKDQVKNAIELRKGRYFPQTDTSGKGYNSEGYKTLNDAFLRTIEVLKYRVKNHADEFAEYRQSPAVAPEADAGIPSSASVGPDGGVGGQVPGIADPHEIVAREIQPDGTTVPIIRRVGGDAGRGTAPVMTTNAPRRRVAADIHEEIRVLEERIASEKDRQGSGFSGSAEQRNLNYLLDTLDDELAALEKGRVDYGKEFADSFIEDVPNTPETSTAAISPDNRTPAPVPEPTPATPPAPVRVAAGQGRAPVLQVATERGTRVDVEYALRPADALITSHDGDMRVNPAYPAELQPRDRQRASSRVQVDRIAQNIQPEFLGESPKASDGAPIVGPDNVVESGNARTIALHKAYRAGHQSAQRYRQWITDNAPRFGLTTEQVQQYKNPVLVRVRKTPVDRVQFAREANEQSVAAMSATEQAMSDAHRMSGDTMTLFVPGEDGNILTDENRRFVQSFMHNVVGKSEQGRYVTAEGKLSQEGVTRMKAAVFAKAYDDKLLVGLYSEETDPNIRTVINGLMMAAPKVSRLGEDIARGIRYGLDIREDVARAALKLSQLKQRGETVEHYLNQGDMFGGGPSSIEKTLLQMYDSNKRSAARIADVVRGFVDHVDKLGDPRQAMLGLDVELPTVEEVLSAAVARARGASVPGKSSEGLRRYVEEVSVFEGEKTYRAEPDGTSGAEGAGGLKEGWRSQKLTPYDTPAIVAARAQAKAIPPTPSGFTLERQKIYADIFYRLEGGHVKLGRRMDIVMGLPGSGKSTQVVEPLSRAHNAFIADSNIIKQMLPEYNGGLGAHAVHKESSWLNAKMMDALMVRGANIVYPTVGNNVDRVRERIARARKHGYAVHLHFVDVPVDVAVRRAVGRFETENRFVDPDYIVNTVGLRPRENYGILWVERKGVDSYGFYNNGVARGRPAELVERFSSVGYEQVGGTDGPGGHRRRNLPAGDGRDGKAEGSVSAAEVSETQGDFFDARQGSVLRQRESSAGTAAANVSDSPADGALFSALSVKFKKEKYLTFADQKINTPADIAFAFRELHNSYGERGFLIGIKNNKAVCVEAIGIGDLGHAAVHPFRPLATVLHLKCDGFYLLHNHPGGTLKFSDPDNNLAEFARQGYAGIGVNYLGHILINGTHFAYRSPEHVTTIIKHHDAAQDPRRVPVYEKYVEWVADPAHLVTVQSPQGAYEVVKGYQVADNAAAVVCLSNSNQVVGLHVMPMARVTVGEVARIAGNNRASAAIIVARVPAEGWIDTIRQIRVGLEKINIALHDGIRIDGDWKFDSLKQMGVFEDAGPYDAQGGYREDNSGYNINDIPDGEVRPAAELTADIKRIVKENGITAAEFRQIVEGITGRSGVKLTPAELDSVLDAVKGKVTDTRLNNEMKNKTYRGTQQPLNLPGEPKRAEFVPVKNQSKRIDPEMRDALMDEAGKFFDLTVGQASEISTLAPIRAAEIQDGKRFGLMKKHLLFAIHDGDMAMHKELAAKRDEARTVFAGLNARDRELVFDVAERKYEKLAARFKELYTDMLDTLNAGRAAIGKAPVAKAHDMVEHFRLMRGREDELFGAGTIGAQKKLRQAMKDMAEVVKGMQPYDLTLFKKALLGQAPITDQRIVKAAAWLRETYDGLLDRINDARVLIGRDPVQKRADYVTHFQELSALQDILQMFGLNMTEVPNSMLAISMYTKPNAPYFKFAKQRTAQVTGKDALKAFAMYLEPALRQIHMSKPLHDARDILEYRVTIPSEYEGSKPVRTSLFAQRYPNAYKYWTNYLNVLAGKRPGLDKMFQGISEWMGATKQFFGPGSIGGNMSTVIAQSSSLKNTVAETGLFALKGQAAMLVPYWRQFFNQHSRVGTGREYETMNEGNRLLGSKALSTVMKKTSKVLSIPLNIADRQMVGGAFLAGYFKGKALGLADADALRYADDVAERTQASANLTDRPPINQGKLKTTLGMFQTFFYNDWSLIRNDIIRQMVKGDTTRQGYGTGLAGIHLSKATGYRALFGMIVATAILSAMYEAMDLPNPLRQEGLGVPGVDNTYSDIVWQHLIGNVPMISQVRFGGAPIMRLGLSGYMALSGDKREHMGALRELGSLGIRMVPGGGQASKMIGAARALADDGRVRGRKRKYLFRIDTDDFREIARAVMFGKWQTKSGQKYLEGRRG